MNKKENILSSGTLTIKELCAVLKISRGTAFALIHSGELNRCAYATASAFRSRI